MGKNDSWTTHVRPDLGTCFTLEVPADAQKHLISDIAVSLKMKGYVFLHHPGQFWRTDGRRNLIQADVGTVSTVDVQYQVRVVLHKNPNKRLYTSQLGP